MKKTKPIQLEPKNLGVLSYVGNFTQWYFETPNDPSKPDFLNRVSERFRAGDEVKVKLTGGKYPRIKNYTVTQSGKNNVVLMEQGKEHHFTSTDNPKTKGKDDDESKPEDGKKGVDPTKTTSGQPGGKEETPEA